MATALALDDVKNVVGEFLPALAAERDAAVAARDTAVSAEKARADSLQAQLNKVNGDVEKLSPLLKSLQTRPDLVEHALRGTRPSAVEHPANTEADPDMVELAKTLDLYDADGSGT